MKNYTFTREATAEEIRDYKLIEQLTANMDDEAFADMMDTISDYFINYGAARRQAYGKAYRIAKKLGVTMNALSNWYFTEVC